MPVRQWVLSLPFELRALAAFKPDVLAALARMFVEAIFAQQRARSALENVVRRVHARAIACLTRRGHVDLVPLEARSNEERARGALERCAAIAMHRGDLRALGGNGKSSAKQDRCAPEAAPPLNHVAVLHEGFNLHASVAIDADDDLGRERLCRYGARPPLSLERLRRLPAGRIGYRIKRLRGGREKLRVMTPLELLARLAALIPPPRYPLVRYHGVLAPRSTWRREIVPKPRAQRACRASSPKAESSSPITRTDSSRHVSTAKGARCDDGRAVDRAPRVFASGDNSPPAVLHRTPPPPAPQTSAPCSPTVRLLAPSILSIRHWDRLLGGALLATSPRIDWATLVRRTFD
ncbi:MAG TPA: transposase, partial [Polyangiaceae bacterium]|nr:transposase [Polyangiaceae bacterium]